MSAANVDRNIVARNALWLVVPPAVMCAMDGLLTLFGQPAEYWAGDYAAAWEGSPSFHDYLTIHPLVAVGAMLLWMAIFSALVLLLPEMLALTLSMAIAIGHMSGAGSWLIYRFHSYQGWCALFPLTAALLVFAFKRGQNSDGRPALDWSRTGLPGWVRWVVIAGLAVLPTWWFLMPR